MTLPRVLALTTYWATTPPVHESVAALLGATTSRAPGAVEPRGVAPAHEEHDVNGSDDAALALLRAFGGAGGIIGADVVL